jgi:dephospho-CoA kinase
MYLVGLTGGIASGKSTVAARFVEHGAELIDADAIAHEVVLPDTPTWRKIVEHFGADVLDADGFIDRPRLGALVFDDKGKRALLNQITHPPVIKEIASRLELFAAFDGLVILDVPLLVETEPDLAYEAIVVVATNADTQVRRLVELRGLTEQAARDRVAAQAPLEAKLARATHVIWNEGMIADLVARTDEVTAELQTAAREKAEREAATIPNE